MATTEAPALSLSTAAGRWVIAITVFGSGIAFVDATVVNIALPAIGRQFHTGVAALQWVVSGYTLTLTAFLLIGGSLGDRFGRRKIYTIGIVWFAITSAACGFAPNAVFLIIMRVLQGIGAALLTPGSLAIIEASFASDDRGRAIGAWSGLGGVATAAGPLLGGYLISAASWRWIFFINVPISVAVVALAGRHVPESHDPTAIGKIDNVGALTGVVFLVGITFAFIEGPTLGWSSPGVIALAVVGVAALAAFLVREHRAASPMLPLSIFRVRQFTSANVVTWVVYAALTGATFLLPTQLQVVWGYTPLAAGLATLPLTIITLGLSARSGRLASRIGPRLQMSVGPLVIAAGFALLSLTTRGSNYFAYVFPGVTVFGLGLAITVAPLTSTAMSAAPAEHSGIASAVNNDVARFGGLIAVAVLPPLAGITGSAYLHPAALSAGFRTAVFIAAALSAAGGVLAALTIRNPPRAAQPARAPAGASASRDAPAVPEVAHYHHCGLYGPPLPPAPETSAPERPAR
jgi:EmrB/QacA subfamily drug resistance transporter